MTHATVSQAPPGGKGHGRGAGIIRLIGIIKLLKAGAIMVAAAVAAHLVKHDAAQFIEQWTHRLHLAPGNHHIKAVLERVLAISSHRWELLSIVLWCYAAMFVIEGVGLLLVQYWAEWMTVITTAGLIPFEVYEIAYKPTVPKFAALLINLAVAIYLAYRVRRDARERNFAALAASKKT